jgi:PHP family Zn ribbon phosphoesterase
MDEVALQPFFADLHVHIGRSQDGQPVKISGSKNLTFWNIAKEASERKGIELIGIIDCHSPAVQTDIKNCLHSGEMEEVEGGGIRYRDTRKFRSIFFQELVLPCVNVCSRMLGRRWKSCIACHEKS